jgi:hypothetical protein
MKCIADDGVVLSRPLGGPPAGGSTPWLPQQSVEPTKLCRVIGRSHLCFEARFPTQREWPSTSLGIVRDAE